MIGILFILGILCSSFVFVKLMKNANIIEAVTVGTTVYFCLHALTSYILFLLDVYSPLRTVASTLGVALIIGIFLLLTHKLQLNSKINTDIKGLIIPILVLLLLLPFTRVKNEYYGMGQDQGVYQSQAMGFINGDTKRIKEFPEYNSFSTEDQELFNTRLQAIAGIQLLHDGYMDSNYGKYDIPAGYYHGIPVFSSFMATWGSIFGIANMEGIQTVFYALFILLTYFCAKNLGLKPYACILSEFAAGFSPIVIWTSKSALTEMFLGVVIVFFLYCMTSRNISEWLSFLPFIIFASYHVSFYTMLPLFIGVYGMQFYLTNKSSYSTMLIGTPVVWAASFWSMHVINPIYTLNNYMFMLDRNVPTSINPMLPRIVYGSAAVILLIVWIFTSVVSKVHSEGTLDNLKKSQHFAWLLRLLMIGTIAFTFISAYMHRNREREVIKAFLHQVRILTMLHFALSAAIILFVIGLIVAIIKPGKLIKNEGIITLSVMFFFSILVNSAILRPSVSSLYYYGRYLTPFIPIAIIFTFYMVSEIKKQAVIPAAALSLCISIPTNVFLMNNVDDTKINWHNLESISEFVTKDDSVIVAKDAEMITFMPMRHLTDAPVYPEVGDIMNQATTLLDNTKGDVYIVSLSPLIYEYDKLQLVYSETVTYVPDPEQNVLPITIYPTTFNETTRPIYVYKLSNDTTPIVYSIDKYYHNFSGLSDTEITFAWTSSEEVNLNCYLHKKTYNMNLKLNMPIPFQALDIDQLDVDVYVNGKLIETNIISSDENSLGFTTTIDSTYLAEGRNTITFKSSIWDASQINPAETRHLGFPIESISFTED